MSVELSPSGEPREPLQGTVKSYRRHLIVCYGRTGWPSEVKEDGLLCQALAQAADRAGETEVRVTASDAPGPRVLDWPSGVAYSGVTESDAEAIIAGNHPSEPLSGTWFFVCVHGARDKRCGQCGPPVTRALRESAQAGVEVWQSSHVGQHQLAANVICYPSGNWYGYVTPDRAPDLVDAETRGERVDDLFRGNPAND